MGQDVSKSARAIRWLAKRFQLSQYKARKYFADVQEFFVEPKPDDYYIAKYISDNDLMNLPEIKQLARLLIENGWNSRLQSEIDLKALKNREYTSNPRLLSSLEEPDVNIRDKDVSPLKDLEKRTLQDQERLAISKLDACPHGIPFGQPCNICDSEKFDERENLQ